MGFLDSKQVKEERAKAEAQKIARVKAEGAIKVEKAKLKKSEELVEQLQGDNKALASRVQNALDVKKKALDVDAREQILKTKETHFENLEKEIKKLEDKIKEAKEKGYKEGYSDGVSDGVRKGMDATKDDRKMMAQIAALAAASHTPEATSMIAREVAAGIAKDINELPATTRSSNSKTK